LDAGGELGLGDCATDKGEARREEISKDETRVRAQLLATRTTSGFFRTKGCRIANDRIQVDRLAKKSDPLSERGEADSLLTVFSHTYKGKGDGMNHPLCPNWLLRPG